MTRLAHGRPTLPKIEGKEQNKKGNCRGGGRKDRNFDL